MYGITVKTHSLLGTLASRRSRTTGRRYASRPGLCANLFHAGVLGMTVLGPLAGSLSLSAPAAAQTIGSGLSSSVFAPLPGQIITLTLDVAKGSKPIQSVSYYVGNSSTPFKTITGELVSFGGSQVASESVNYMIPGNQPAGSLTFTAKITYKSGGLGSYTTTVSVGSPPALSYYVGSNSDIWSYSGATNTSTDLGWNTASNLAPVLYGNSLYFADKTGQLWQITGSNGPQKVGTIQVSATPVVTSGRIYYRGTDKQLWGAALDGSNPQKLGGNNGLLSSPVVYGGYIYYAGYNNPNKNEHGQIYRTNLDGAYTTKLGDNYSAPVNILVSGGYIYYVGYDKGQIYRTNLDGTSITKLGKNYANGAPAVYGNSIYYWGTDNHLYSANLSDGSSPKKLFTNNITIYTTPSIGNGKIFFVDSKNLVWEVNLDGTGLVQIGNAPSAIAPFALDPTNQPTTGQILPNFQVAAVIYAAPGSAATRNSTTYGSNYVGYGSSSTLGQTVSNTLGTSSDYDVSSNVNLAGSGATSGITYGATNTYETTEIMSSTSSLFSYYYSFQSDGLTHDLDEFYLIQNPAVNFSITSADMTVAYAPTTQTDPCTGQPAIASIVHYTAYDLKKFLSSPDTNRSSLFQGWLTVADCRAILRLDPYVSDDLRKSNPIVAPDSKRYTLVKSNLQYCRDNKYDRATNVLGNSTYTYTLSQSASVSYDTSYTYSLTAGLETDVEGVGIGASQTYTTTNSTFLGTTTGTTNTISQYGEFQIVQASALPGNGIATYIDVYIDNIYNTFMFYPHN